MNDRRSNLSVFMALLSSMGGVFNPAPADPRKDRKVPRSISGRARPLNEHQYVTRHGTVYRKYPRLSSEERRAKRKERIAELKARRENEAA